MNTAFFHDSNFVYNNNKYYTLSALNKNKLQEYVENFGNITIVVRVDGKNNNNEKAVREENLVDNVEVNGVLKNYINVRKVVKKQFRSCDFAIIRMPSIIGMVACREARKQKIPYMIEMVGCPRDALWYHSGIKYKLAMPFLVLNNKYELKKSKYTIYVTENFLESRYPTKGKYIGCSDVELQENDYEILDKRIQKIRNKKEKDIYRIGLIGSLNVDYKGHETSIKALSIIKDKINFELHFLGVGNKEKWIKLVRKNKIEDKVFFDGMIPHNYVFKWLDDLDVFLIPSLAEGLPRALIEAMSRGCPCIGTKIGGIPELLKENRIIKKKDYKDLSNKILQLVGNKEEMIKDAKINFQMAKEFEKNKLKNKKEKFYYTLLKSEEENFTNLYRNQKIKK